VDQVDIPLELFDQRTLKIKLTYDASGLIAGGQINTVRMLVKYDSNGGPDVDSAALHDWVLPHDQLKKWCRVVGSRDTKRLRCRKRVALRVGPDAGKQASRDSIDCRVRLGARLSSKVGMQLAARNAGADY